ncbi:MAG: hypothetical protein ABIG39_00335 [Candidatus Micrarchaeota archaeon]
MGYLEIYPEFRPWGTCSPLLDVYKPCITESHNGVLFLENSERCEFDSHSGNYLVGNQYFSFVLDALREGTMYFQMLECYYGPESIGLVVNDKCIIEIMNEGYQNQHVAPRVRSVSLDESCLELGENRVWIDGTVTMSVGGGQCPELACLDARLYADIVFPETRLTKQVIGSVDSMTNTTHYTFQVTVGDEASGSLTLPSGSFDVGCDNGCEIQNYDVFVGSGTTTLEYQIENLEVRILFENEYSAYFENESLTAIVMVYYNDIPNSADVYFEDGGLACHAVSGICEVGFPVGGVGEHNITLTAVHGPNGRRGRADATYVVEHRAEVEIREFVDGTGVVVEYKIQNIVHCAFDGVFEYSLPEDYEGNLVFLPEPENVSKDDGIVSFGVYCPPYTNCSYELRFSVFGAVLLLGKPVFPDTIAVGETAIGTCASTISNTNQLREIETTVELDDCIGSCSWEFILPPGASEEFEFLVERTGAEECGFDVGDGWIDVCISLPQGFPEGVALEYLIPGDAFLRFERIVDANLDGRVMETTARSEGLFISLGILHGGEHILSINYMEVDYVIEPPEISTSVPETEEPVEKNDVVGLPVAGGSEIDSLVNDVEIVTVDACGFGHIVQVIVLTGDSPGVGIIKFISPSGKVFTMDVVDGRANHKMDESGVWNVCFGGEQTSILVGAKTINRDEKEMAIPNSVVGGVYAGGSNGTPEIYLGVVLLLLFPVMLVPIFGYLAFVVMREEHISLRKVYDGRTVLLEIENHGRGVTDVRISDMLPKDADVRETGGGSIKSTTIATVIRWRRPSLERNELWRVRYGVGGGSGGRAMFSVVDESGNTLYGKSSGTKLVLKHN